MTLCRWADYALLPSDNGKNNSSLPFKSIVPSGNLPEPYIEIAVFVLVSLSKLDSSNVDTESYFPSATKVDAEGPFLLRMKITEPGRLPVCI